MEPLKKKSFVAIKTHLLFALDNIFLVPIDRILFTTKDVSHTPIGTSYLTYTSFFHSAVLCYAHKLQTCVIKKMLESKCTTASWIKCGSNYFHQIHISNLYILIRALNIKCEVTLLQSSQTPLIHKTNHVMKICFIMGNA